MGRKLFHTDDVPPYPGPDTLRASFLPLTSSTLHETCWCWKHLNKWVKKMVVREGLSPLSGSICEIVNVCRDRTPWLHALRGKVLLAELILKLLKNNNKIIFLTVSLQQWKILLILAFVLPRRDASWHCYLTCIQLVVTSEWDWCYELKGNVTRDDLHRRFWAEHCVPMLEQCCNHSKQCCKAVLR